MPIQLYCEKLFTYLDRKYYIGLFSTAKFHGASYQQVQRDYLITELPKFIDISKGALDIRFFTASNWIDKNIQLKKSDAGIFKLSSPALTLVDLIQHQTMLGRVNRILATIEELSEELSKSDLIELLSWYPNRSTLQRLGYLMEELGLNKELQEILYTNVSSENFFPVLLSPKSDEKP